MKKSLKVICSQKSVLNKPAVPWKLKKNTLRRHEEGRDVFIGGVPRGAVNIKCSNTIS